MNNDERIASLEATMAKQTLAIKKLCDAIDRLETASKGLLTSVELLAGLEAKRGGGAKPRDLN